MWALWIGLAMAGEGGFDHAYTDLGAAFAGAVRDSGVDYAAIGERRAKLDAALAEMASAEASDWSRHQKLALYINAYNACTVRLVLDHQPLKSIRDLDGGNPWKVRTCTVAGEELTLDAIEHQRVRKLGDGRIHAAVNCASKGCPPLPAKPFTPVGLDAQLTAAARTWTQVNAYQLDGTTLRVSKIFDWYKADFTTWAPAEAVPGANAAQANAVGFLRAMSAVPLPAFERVDDADYDWSLNAR